MIDDPLCKVYAKNKTHNSNENTLCNTKAYIVNVYLHV